MSMRVRPRASWSRLIPSRLMKPSARQPRAVQRGPFHSRFELLEARAMLTATSHDPPPLLAAPASPVAALTSTNAPPIARGDSVVGLNTSPTVIDVLANDSDPDGALDPASVTIITPAAHGTTGVDPATGHVT